MSFINLGLNLAASSSVDVWFHLKQAVLQSACTAKSNEHSTIQQNNVMESYPFKLFPSNKLLTWAPETVIDNASSDDQILMDTNHVEEYCDTLFDCLLDCHNSIIEIEGLKSPSSSASLNSLSCYSCESEEDEANYHECESSFSSLFEEDCIDHSIILKPVATSSFSISEPNHTDIPASEETLLLEPISLKNRSWNEQINHLATDEEWDEHIDELAKEFEKEMGFDSETEFLSFDSTITRISAAFDCKEEEVDNGDLEDIFLSPRSFDEEEFEQSFDSLFDGEDSMIIEIENSDNSQQTIKESNNDFKQTEQEKHEYQLLSLHRHARAIRKNPHLFHLFR
ncbi:uncharacterized protein MELLADRAFT_107665 [Melampsora larici-populina 98AG31]|uniref:Uncharacterized protein n=1 Tax=Melampsora larici-populina (strain 98AG31 / pathotype 3-4-7) TaxID=747676 RepID=F4RQD0_MELLP|nr:uncharacterized protein MELLADRAFT_107665 [Melampsora larici-populina 98AG31]EGG05428.1 hypothetical protein MELLADRAFT_107665 [Melampsora larici-populina 98AG31]